MSEEAPAPHVVADAAVAALGHYSGHTTKAWREANTKITQTFHEDLEKAVFGDNLQRIDPRKLAKLWEHAWREGHSSGYQEVENLYRDLSDLVRP